MNTYTITLGQVTNNGAPCSAPIITLAGHSSSAVVNCIDETKGIYQVQTTDELAGTNLEFIVQCSECDDCPPTVINVSLCDDNGDCGECQVCGPNGYCVSLCEGSQSCVNDKCVDCTSSEECSHNQVCVNGSCGCPDGRLPGPDGRCSDCDDNADCGPCEVCQSGVCSLKDCVDGVCDPSSGGCIDCLNSGDCDVNESCTDGSCDCVDGFTRINGVCVSVECELDNDCPNCYQCSNNSCIPVTCPAGRVPSQVNGECQCVQECDPNNPSCPDGSYCGPSQVDGLYACVPCQGSCEDGCSFPCVCDQFQEICTANPCINVSCTDGSDCGHGCGCLDGQCTPCSSSACPGIGCSEVAGCKCMGNSCRDADEADNCANNSCEISSDCGVGCTCVAGQCTSCDNFNCAAGTCAEKDGCQCIGGSCTGEDITSSCTDVLEISKDDAACTLTGTLTKDQCCSCPDMTISISPKESIAVIGENIALAFRAEVRKGTYLSTNPTGNPRVDDIGNADIAENDIPTTGAVQMTYRNRYNVYSVSYDGQGNEIRNFTGTTLGSRSVKTSAFSGLAFADFSGSISKIGAEIQESGVVKVVSEVIVSFALTSSLDFPNTCSYNPGPSIGSYVIKSNESVGVLGFKGAGVTSDDCRLPLFKWYKSSSNSFDAIPFRKRYISGDGTYTDILTDLQNDGLEPCKTYLLETDCTCEDSKTKRVVFCNPTDLQYSLDGCNTKLSFGDSFIPCVVNTASGVEYYVKAGDFYKTFTASSYPANRSFMSMTPITEVEFGQVCDVDGECTKIYPETVPTITGIVNTTCNGDGTFTANFAESPGCVITKIVISNGSQVVGSTKVTLPAGEYIASIYTDCNCPPLEISLVQQCCSEITAPNCYRECGGTVVGCAEATGVTYTNESGIEISSLKEFVSSANPSEGLIINASRPGCPLVQFTIPASAQTCCDGFRYEFIKNSTATGGTINVYGGNTVTVTITAQASSGGSPTVTKVNDSLFTVTGMVDGESYDIQVSDSVCTLITDAITPTACDIGMTTVNNCQMYAQVPTSSCTCSNVAFEAEVTGIQVLEESFVVDWRAKVLSPNVDIDTLEFIDNYGSSKKNKPQSTNQVTISRIASNGEIVNSALLNISLKSLILVDNCTYSNKTRSFRIYANGSSVPANVSSMSVIPDVSEAKFPKFVWTKGNVVFSEYQELISEITDDTKVFGYSFLQQGESYEVEVRCDECSEEAALTYCCTPTIDVTVSNCNKQVLVSITGSPGDYQVQYNGAGSDFSITDRGTAVLRTFTHSTAFTDTSVTVTSLADNSCTFSESVPLITPCDPTINTSACAGGKYDVTLSGCNGAAYTISEVSGASPDSITGNVLNGVGKNSALVVTAANPATGCVNTLEAGVDWADPCLVACDPKAWSTPPVAFVEGTCVSTAYQNDGAISLTSNDTSGTVDKYAVSSLLPAGSTVADFDGNAYAAATSFIGVPTGTALTSGLANGPGVVVVRFYQGSDDCYTAFAVDVPETDCTCLLTYSVDPTSATCSSLTENGNGKVTLSGYTNVTHYGISTEDASSYDGPTTVATATAVSTDPEDIITGVPNVNPNGSGSHSYIVRLFGTTDVCFEDVEVSVLDKVCECGGPNTASNSAYEVGTCDAGGVAQNDAQVIWKLSSGQTDAQADRYHIVTGGIFDENLTYATATALPSPTTPGNGWEYLLKSDAPTSGGTYTFRVYDGDNSCSLDFTVTIPGTVCTSACDAVCDGKANGYVCNGAGTECLNGECVVSSSCTSDPCTFSGFDSSGCPVCKNRNAGYSCGTNSECDGAGNCVAATGACCGYDSSGLGCDAGVTESQCTSNGGTFQGDGSTCSTTQQAVQGGNTSISRLMTCNSGTSFRLLTHTFEAALNCSGCECAPYSLSYRRYKNGVPVASGTIITTTSDCGIGVIDMSSSIWSVSDGFGLNVGDVLEVEYRVRNSTNGGCLISGSGDYSATYTVTSVDVIAYNSCFAPEATGACCEYDGDCTTKTESDCVSGNGIYGGDGVSCVGSECYGSCCLNGACLTNSTRLSCDDYAGTWIDYKGTCSDVCFGACCTGTNCVYISEGNCSSGTWLGGGVPCNPNPCSSDV